MFAYCGNNPINRVDPSGREWVDGYEWKFWVWTDAELKGLVKRSGVTDEQANKIVDTINDNGLKDLAISSVGILITLNSNKALDIILVLSNTQYEDYIFRLDNYMNDFQFGGGGIAFLETGGGILAGVLSSNPAGWAIAAVGGATAFGIAGATWLLNRHKLCLGYCNDIKNDSGVAFRYTMGVFTFPTYEYFPYRD